VCANEFSPKHLILFENLNVTQNVNALQKSNTKLILIFLKGTGTETKYV
jgi:hypothetical protein